MVKEINELLTPTIQGREVCVVTMHYNAAKNKYNIFEVNTFDYEDYHTIMRNIISDAEYIFEKIIFNNNILEKLRQMSYNAWRYYDSRYINRFISYREGENFVSIEILGGKVEVLEQEKAGIDGHSEFLSLSSIIPDSEVIEEMIDRFVEGKDDPPGHSIMYSSVNDMGQCFHLFIKVPEFIHPEMRSEVNIEVSWLC